eukprot:Protomagalhaensia_sp_Gyna_25__1734@NODE_1908_length_1427_cov_47_574928_g1568_i0_p1_GENE_NODE_1908_length_1427_cov_47_574928_g1568_i0NODE_1908_length_1427_cov_47_574928_g1568_i0_p1_ORF_typecomplete_len344_score68_66TFIIF_beta/PF02270_15/1_8e04TFIIF_beta/PF02270_15/0_0082Rrf2/PF02082_20/0_09TFIIF_beta_N/PF17683_1/0_21_NODE_1908_length_1427_cov_47_574928_g1568_i0671098
MEPGFLQQQLHLQQQQQQLRQQQLQPLHPAYQSGLRLGQLARGFVSESEPSTAPATPKKWEDASLPETTDPAVIGIRNSEAVLIKVPDFVSEYWLSQRPGTVLGVLEAKRKPVIHLPEAAALPVGKINAVSRGDQLKGRVPSREDSSELVLSATSMGRWPVPATTRIEGAIRGAPLPFLPDVLESGYRDYVQKRKPTTSAATPLVLSAAESAQLHQRLVEDVSEASDQRRLFHYYGQAGGDAEDFDADDDGAGGSGVGFPRKKRRLTQLSTEDGQAKLFRFFETKGGQPASMKEIVNYLGTSQTFTKQLLDRLAEPVRERQGKRVSYILKPEYGGSHPPPVPI